MRENLSKQLSNAYIFGLGIIALLTILSQFLVHNYIQEQEADSRVVNISGRQRMLSQKLMNLAILLGQESTEEQTDKYIQDLKGDLQTLTDSHWALRNGDGDLGIPRGYNSARIQALFQEAQPYFESIEESSLAIIQGKGLLSEHREKLLGELPIFLDLMNQITFVFDDEAQDKVYRMDVIFYALGILTIVVLVLIASFIFQPAVKRVEALFRELYDSNQKLKISEHSYRTILELANDAIFIANTQSGKIVDTNLKGEALLKKSREEILSLHQSQLHPPGYPNSPVQDFKADVTLDGHLREMEVVTSEGEIIPVEISSRVTQSLDNRKLLVGIFRDIRERKAREREAERYQKELEASLIQLRQTQHQLIKSEKVSALGHLMAGIAHEINTPIGAIQASSENIERQLLDIVPQIPEGIQRFSPEQLSFFLELKKRIPGDSQTLSLKEIRTTKRKIWRQLESQQVTSVDAITNQLLELKIYDLDDWLINALREKDKLEVLLFLYKVTNLWNSNQIILRALSKASKMLFALKNFTHFDQQGDPQEINLVKNIEDVLLLYQNKMKVGVELQLNYLENPKIFGYPDQLNQVWNNLIHNALEAMNYDGKLEIEIISQESEVIISIKDNGMGIADAVKNRIFEPFFTTKAAGQGSGLGLDIVKKVVDVHQGKVFFDSEEGQGSTFWVHLPKKINLENHISINHPREIEKV